MGKNTKYQSRTVPMHPQTITPTCFRLVQKLSKIPEVAKFYLVGGTALALQQGHRKSIDLDFFTDKQVDYHNLQSNLEDIAKLKVFSKNPRFLKLELDKVKTEFIYFAYKPKFKLIEWEGIKMVNPVDIGLYKLLAILGRTTKKDIIDLFEIHTNILPLPELFKIFMKKFDKGDINLFKRVELLFDKTAMEDSEEPDLLKKINFDEALETVSTQILTSIKQELNLTQ